MRITDVRARTVCVPIQAPLRHSSGVHPGHFIRTIVELQTDDGIVGLGEVGGGDQRSRVAAIAHRLLGQDPFHLERIKLRVLSRIHYLRSARIYAAVEMACLDAVGKAVDRPVCDLLGGPVRDRVPFTAYLFTREQAGACGPVTTPAQFAEHLGELVEVHGFTSAKLKAGVEPPDHDLRVLEALRSAQGSDFGLRVDPNGVWSLGTAVRAARDLAGLDLEYLEDPTWGLPGMARVKARAVMPLATNMVVTEFSHLPPALALEAVDIVLGDIYHFDGLTGLRNLAAMCETFGLGLSMHSGTELGVAMAAMVHVAATLPNLAHACDAHYHHLLDDVIAGGTLPYRDGTVTVPDGPGLGVELDAEKMDRYERAFEDLGDYQGGQRGDPGRPEWSQLVPAW